MDHNTVHLFTNIFNQKFWDQIPTDLHYNLKKATLNSNSNSTEEA